MLFTLSCVAVVSIADNSTDVSTLTSRQTISSLVDGTSAFRKETDVEKIIIAVSQSFVYFISHLDKTEAEVLD